MFVEDTVCMYRIYSCDERIFKASFFNLKIFYKELFGVDIFVGDTVYMYHIYSCDERRFGNNFHLKKTDKKSFITRDILLKRRSLLCFLA